MAGERQSILAHTRRGHRPADRYGARCLRPVFDAIRPSAILGRDRTPFVRVVENVGSEQDAPILVSTLAVIVGSSMKQDAPYPGKAENDSRDAMLEAAIHRALEKLTKTKNTATSRADRLKFWLSWWETNVRRIVYGNGPAKR